MEQPELALENKQSAPPLQTNKKGWWVKQLYRDRQLYYLLLPVIAWFLIFQYKPMYGLLIAFKDYSVFRGVMESPWNNFEHFKAYFDSPYFIRTLSNTLLISLYSLLFQFPAPIILALLLNEVRRNGFKKWIQTLTYLPHFVSVVVVAGIVVNFLSPSAGIINVFLEAIGFDRQYFLIIPEYFRTIFISMNIWQEAGFSAIIYMSALAGINPSLYEAAVIDGANRWKQTIHVTLPGIMPTILILLLLKIGHILDVGYEAILLLYNESTYNVADVISTYVYRAGLIDGQFGIATAAGLFNAVVGFILVVYANRITKKLTQTGLW